ncbi:hypothetical protein [Sandarakinorhabdus rubra]|uniref:hypothetical protein n=1 Tax=Sandarakinorhabdus rubra TaxID=2672568 RepID=UPI0013DC4165|nr:hypothetical protein [Sandarakinorhabdus rubra]
MHPFPSASTLDAFIGDEVAQVWLDPYGVRFIFESQSQIYAETSVMQIEPNGKEWLYECVGHDGAPVVFHRLLNKPIVSVEREDLRLILRMEDGSALVVYSELGSHESGHIIMGSGDFIVF